MPRRTAKQAVIAPRRRDRQAKPARHVTSAGCGEFREIGGRHTVPGYANGRARPKVGCGEQADQALLHERLAKLTRAARGQGQEIGKLLDR